MVRLGQNWLKIRSQKKRTRTCRRCLAMTRMSPSVERLISNFYWQTVLVCSKLDRQPKGLPTAKTLFHTPVWRNWQTRWIQNPLGATPWRFKSSHRYFFICTQMKRTARLGIYRVGLFLLHTQSARNSCVLPRLLLRLFSSQVLE